MKGVNALTSRLKRPLVVLLIGAGWLSILGNSPGDEVLRRWGARTGPIQIEATEGVNFSGCSLNGQPSAPVRRAALYRGATLMYEVACVDGSDCLSHLNLPLETSGCTRVEADAGRADARSPADRSPDLAGDVGADVGPDAAGLVDADPPEDARPPLDQAADATDNTSDAASAAFARQAPNPGDLGSPQLWKCRGERGASFGLSATQNGRPDQAICNDEKSVYRIVVETADGVSSTQEFRIEVKEAEGYFGC